MKNLNLSLVIQERALAHLLRCTAWAGDAETEDEDPAYGEFCGCGECIVREVLYSSWVELLQGAAAVIEDNTTNHTAVNEIYRDALTAIAAGKSEHPQLLAQVALGEATA